MDDHVAKTIAVYDQIAKKYAKKIESYVIKEDRDEFLSFLQAKVKILDLGCAAGRDCRYFASHGHTVTGVDLSTKLLAIAKSKSPDIDYQQQDIHNLKFPNNYFDGIYACAVLLHLKRDNISTVLKRIWLLLKPHGILYVQVKKGTGEGEVSEPFTDGVRRHFTYFQPDEIRKMYQDTGFFVVKINQRNEREINPSWRDIVWITAIGEKLN